MTTIEEQVTALRDERDRLFQGCQQAASEITKMKEELQSARARIDMLEQQIEDRREFAEHMLGERDWYMRHKAELVAGVESVIPVLETILEKANHGVYRKNGGMPKDPPAIQAAVEEIRKLRFMQDDRHQPGTEVPREKL